MILSVLAWILAIAIGAPALVIGVEALLALLPLRRNRFDAAAPAPRLAVIVPANDEEFLVARSVATLRRQLQPGDRLIVVADNCTDATADRARDAGTEVWERHDLTGLGKAYAVNFAFDRLRDDPPEVVAIVDADCVPDDGCLALIARLAHQRRQPVQAAYTMAAPAAMQGLNLVSAFAVYVKNVVRPRSLQRLGLPCLLNGSGMAFPWEAIEATPYSTGHLAEDYRYTMDLAVRGSFVIPCMEATVRSELPSERKGFFMQRTRWEQGHLAHMLQEIPRALASFLRTGSPRILALLPDLIVPPLSLLAGSMALGIGALAGIAVVTDAWAPLATLAASSALAAAGLFAVWFREGRTILPAAVALQIPKYVMVKAPLYTRFITARERTWRRTDRAAGPVGEPVGAAAPHVTTFKTTPAGAAQPANR